MEVLWAFRLSRRLDGLFISPQHLVEIYEGWFMIYSQKLLSHTKVVDRIQTFL